MVPHIWSMSIMSKLHGYLSGMYCRYQPPDLNYVCQAERPKKGIMRFAIKSFPPIGAVQFVIYQACLATSGSEALNEAKSALYPENILPHDTISTNLCTESHHFQQLLTGTTYSDVQWFEIKFQ